MLFDSEFGVETYTFFQDLVADGLAVNVGENPQGTDNLFKLADATEPAAMTIFTSAGISSVIQVLSGGLIPGFAAPDLGIGRLPSPGGVTVGGASLWLVEDQPAEEIAATWDFVQYLVSAQTQSDWANGTGYVPINEDAVDLAPLADTYTNDPRFRVPYDQLVTGETNEATAGPVLGPARQIRGVVATALPAGRAQQRRRPAGGPVVGGRTRPTPSSPTTPSGRGRAERRRAATRRATVAGSKPRRQAPGSRQAAHAGDHVVEVVPAAQPRSAAARRRRRRSGPGRPAAGAELRARARPQHPPDRGDDLQHRRAGPGADVVGRRQRPALLEPAAAPSTWASARSPTWM